MARVSIGPGSAVVLGVALVFGTGHGDRLLHAVQRAAGPGLLAWTNHPAAADSGTGGGAPLSAADVAELINSAVERTLQEMRDLMVASHLPRGGGAGAVPVGSGWPVFGIKCLLATGAVVGICQILEVDLSGVLGVSRKSLGVAVEGAQRAVEGMAAGCGESLQTLAALVRRYRGNVRRVEREAGEELGRLEDELGRVRGQVAEVAESFGRMNELSWRANSALRVVCYVLAEALPDSKTQHALTAFASGQSLLLPESAAEGKQLTGACDASCLVASELKQLPSPPCGQDPSV